MPELGVIGGWATHRTAEGREYYYNKETNTTTWEKPDVLKAAEEKGAAVSAAVATSSWKEFSDASGKKYYHNTKTKQTQWTMPDELKAAAAEDEKKAFIEKSKVPLPPFSALSRAPPPSSAVPRPLPRSYRTHHHRP